MAFATLLAALDEELDATFKRRITFHQLSSDSAPVAIPITEGAVTVCVVLSPHTHRVAWSTKQSMHDPVLEVGLADVAMDARAFLFTGRPGQTRTNHKLFFRLDTPLTTSVVRFTGTLNTHVTKKRTRERDTVPDSSPDPAPPKKRSRGT